MDGVPTGDESTLRVFLQRTELLSDNLVEIIMFRWLKILLTAGCLLLGIGMLSAESYADSSLLPDQPLADDTQPFVLDNAGKSDGDDCGATQSAWLAFAEPVATQVPLDAGALSAACSAPSHRQPPARASPTHLPA